MSKIILEVEVDVKNSGIKDPYKAGDVIKKVLKQKGIIVETRFEDHGDFKSLDKRKEYDAHMAAG